MSSGDSGKNLICVEFIPKKKRFVIAVDYLSD
jgi:hypothetical protein